MARITILYREMSQTLFEVERALTYRHDVNLVDIGSFKPHDVLTIIEPIVRQHDLYLLLIDNNWRDQDIFSSEQYRLWINILSGGRLRWSETIGILIGQAADRESSATRLHLRLWSDPPFSTDLIELRDYIDFLTGRAAFDRGDLPMASAPVPSAGAAPQSMDWADWANSADHDREASDSSYERDWAGDEQGQDGGGGGGGIAGSSASPEEIGSDQPYEQSYSRHIDQQEVHESAQADGAVPLEPPPATSDPEPTEREEHLPGGYIPAPSDLASEPREVRLKYARYDDIVAVGRPANAERLDVVEFAVSHPSGAVADIPIMIDAWMFQPDDREVAIKRAREELGADAKFRSGASSHIKRGTVVKVEVKIEAWRVEPEFQAIVWTGNVANAAFRVFPPTKVLGGIAHGICKFSADGLRVGTVPFSIRIGASADATIQVSPGKSVRTAFASYASKDRRRVLARVQGLQKFVKVFVDVRDLDSGANYPLHLLEQIKASDALYLFWSRHAKKSDWVEKEWRYGLAHHGIDFIDPIPLADPRKVPPPPELGESKHFNDWVLAYIEYEKSLGIWHRIRAWMDGD